MIDTLPGAHSLAQVRALHPRAMIIRYCRADKCWLVFHSVEAAFGHPTAEPIKPQTVNRPVVMNRSW